VGAHPPQHAAEALVPCGWIPLQLRPVDRKAPRNEAHGSDPAVVHCKHLHLRLPACAHEIIVLAGCKLGRLSRRTTNLCLITRIRRRAPGVRKLAPPCRGLQPWWLVLDAEYVEGDIAGERANLRVGSCAKDPAMARIRGVEWATRNLPAAYPPLEQAFARGISEHADPIGSACPPLPCVTVAI
jgi:hypothetical protein